MSATIFATIPALEVIGRQEHPEAIFDIIIDAFL